MHYYMHPFLFVIRFGELITSNRLSYVKHKANLYIKQEKNAFCRIFLLLIEYFNHNYLIINTRLKD